MSSKEHEATFYVQVERKPRQQYRNGKYITASATKLTQEKPSITPRNCVTVKLTIKIADAAFEPISPAVTVTVPDTLVQHPIHIIVEDPT